MRRPYLSMETESSRYLEVTLDNSIFYVNAMPPGPPIVPAMEVSVVLPAGVLPDRSDSLVLVVFDREGAPAWQDSLSLSGQGDAKKRIKLASAGTPWPEGNYRLKAMLAARTECAAEIAFEIKYLH